MIAIVCPFPPWFNGGVETVIRETSKHLIHKYDIEIFCTDPAGKEIGTHTWQEIPVHVFKSFPNNFYFASPKLLKALKNTDFDMIHAHSLNSFMPIAASIAKNNKPLILNPHYHPKGSQIHYALLKSLYDPIFAKYVFNKSDEIICVSNIERDLLRKKSKKLNQIQVIPNGIDLKIIEDAPTMETKERFILYVGRIEKYKNIQNIVQTLPYLPDDYSFYIVGNGSYKPELTGIIEKNNLSKRVKILSGLSNEEVYKLMKGADVFVTLSELEAFGITAIESLAAGTSVIVNNKGGLSELAAKHKAISAFEVEDNNQKKLADLIMEKSGIAVNTDLSEYRWENIVKKIGGIYDRYSH